MTTTDNTSAIVRASYVQPVKLYIRRSLTSSILIFVATISLISPVKAGEKTYHNAGTYTWTVPPEADGHNVDFIASGGGGGGGNGDDSNSSQNPGWGANGGYGCLPVAQSLRNFGLVAHTGDVYTIIIGKGGLGGQTNGSGGSPGDQTSISAGPVGANPSLFVVTGAPGAGHTHNVPQGAQSGASTGGNGCFRGNEDATNGQSITVNGALVRGGIGQVRYAPNANYGGGGGGGGASQGIGGNGAKGGADQGSGGTNHNGLRGADGIDGGGGGGGGGGGDAIGKGGPGGNGGDGVFSILW